MRIERPASFQLEFSGPQGPYRLCFEPLDEWDGAFVVEGLAHPMRWSVLSIDRKDTGELIFSGMTDGSQVLWGDQYWYEAQVEPEPARVSFWGDRVLVRIDEASAIGRIDTNG